MSYRAINIAIIAAVRILNDVFAESPIADNTLCIQYCSLRPGLTYLGFQLILPQGTPTQPTCRRELCGNLHLPLSVYQRLTVHAQHSEVSSRR